MMKSLAMESIENFRGHRTFKRRTKILFRYCASDGLGSSYFPLQKVITGGLSIEYDEKKYNKMKFLYKNFASVLESRLHLITLKRY